MGRRQHRGGLGEDIAFGARLAVAMSTSVAFLVILLAGVAGVIFVIGRLLHWW